MQKPPAILGARLWFPDPSEARRTGRHAGLVAIGGDFSVARLLLAYRSGIFPWTDDPPTWWSPDPRGILPLEGLHVSRSLARTLRSGRFRVTVNQDFERVMTGCAAPAPGREETWISPAFVAAYTQLHAAGHAHSIECWHGNELAGGLYGVAVGGLFAGESMFHRVSDASKVAVVATVTRLRERGFALFDLQMLTPVTRQLGATAIPRRDYLRQLADAVERRCEFAGGTSEGAVTCP